MGRTRREVNDPACGQFMALKDVSMFKERKVIDQMELVKKRTERLMKAHKRSLDF